MAEKHTTRIDKWLWEVRIFKTRVLASEACAGGKIKIDGTTVKASRNIMQNDIVQVRKGIIKYVYKVRKIAEKRMSAKLVPDFLEDMTPEEELAKLQSAQKQPIQTREKGQGRPTKKERRVMDKVRDKY
jgi:ribosome-associated heat shock protein Hsp15